MDKPENPAKDANAPITAEDLGPQPVCEKAEYPHYEPGEYDAECLAAVTYPDPRFRTWKCKLQFSIMPDCVPVYAFLNLGRGENPHAGPGSEYRRVWIIAARSKPKKRQVLSNRVFKGKLFRIRIGDVTGRFDGRRHPEAAVYSVVKEILERIF